MLADDKERQEHLARYITLAPLRLDAVYWSSDPIRPPSTHNCLQFLML
jgi:hypothetical protein